MPPFALRASSPLLLAFAFLCGSTANAANAAAPAITPARSWHDPLTLRWRTPTIRLEIERGFPPHLKRALKRAASAWNDTGAAAELIIAESARDEGGESGVVAGVDGSAEERGAVGEPAEVFARDGHNRVAVYSGDWPFPKEAAAVTRTWTADDGASLVEADVALNPSLQWEVGGATDPQNAITHELGHVLGLPDVRDARDATMFYMMLPGETLKRDLSHPDEQMLFTLYQGIDAPMDGGCNGTGGQPGAFTVIFVIGALARVMKRQARGA